MNKVMFWVKKIIVYCIGLFILALGVSVSVRSNLGVSPVNSIPLVSSYITKIDFGVCVTTFLCICIFIQFLILRKDFKIFNVLQIVCSTIFGLFVNFTNTIIQTHINAPTNYISSLIMLLISIVFVAIGVSLYLKADIILLPCEGIMKAITQKIDIKFSSVKMMFDTSVVLIATILILVFFNKLEGVREGTIIAAIGVGLVMKLIDKPITKTLNKIL